VTCLFEPTITIVLPTYNSSRTIKLCLKSIQAQNYPKEKLKVIIVDGGSFDDTLEICTLFDVYKIVKNPLIAEEAGKPIAIKMADTDLILFIDSDNILSTREWISKMVQPFADEQIVATEPLYYHYRRSDGLLTRYVSLLGADDALDPYIGGYDRFCYLRNKWAEQPMTIEDKGEYLKIVLSSQSLPPMGANGYMVRRQAMNQILYTPLHIHTDTIYRLVKSGYNCMAKVKIGIVHLHSNNVTTFIRKKIRRIQKYYLWKKHREYYPPRNTAGLQNFFLQAIFLLPIVMDVMRAYKRIPDRAWLFHIPACYLTLLAYSVGILQYLTSRLVRKILGTT